MDELELVRLHEDGDRLVVAGPDGAEHMLPITDALRAAVRGDRPRMESIRADEELAMRPRDIQARLRAGATADDLAAESGMPAEQIRRFEYPVISEREHAVGRVRAKAVMSEDGGTATIGDLADKRLRERHSDPATIRWTATRDGVAPWVVTLTFTVDAGERVARWSFDPRGGAVIALDDEARWLALPEDDGGPVSRTVTALPPTRGYGRAAVVDDETDLLLDGLSERRGQRPQRSADPADIDAGELDLDDLSPRRRRPGPTTPGYGTPRPGHTPGRPAPAESAGAGSPGAGSAGSGPGAQGPDSFRPATSRTGASGTAEHSPDGPGDSGTSDDEPAPAAVVDLGARRGKHSTENPSGESAESSHGGTQQLEWDGPSQWEIPGPERDDERRPRTAALRTGGPLTGAVPKALRPATTRKSRSDGGTGAAGDSADRHPGDHSAARPPTAGHPAAGDTGGPDAGRSEDRTGPDKSKSSRRRSSRRGRAQVPSWDEIVFGSRPEG
ncbi:septation protein SepH [Myceligenerans pegani]|uniref:DUF3071 domain-containing protein n=1 Tax=Myceligenerans pegani TaxID=2776917 RepID=A0ABR9N0H3_9MICO|nr:septation protein SepH [Myceligenerans sp. TRM 65318]MBE1876850.1 DUF3071 domain-containing protein [Myceligenerans sp. TRM 65318]MBE3019121.1 DUF3071 domain-containing protein [Myceligenerans sp. TRM 65318]